MLTTPLDVGVCGKELGKKKNNGVGSAAKAQIGFDVVNRKLLMNKKKVGASTDLRNASICKKRLGQDPVNWDGVGQPTEKT